MQMSGPSGSDMAQQPTKRQYAYYAFDAYGTLFDVHSAASRHAAEIGPGWERLSQVWRTKHLEYTWIWAGTGRHTTFWKLAGDSLDTAIATVGGIPPGARDKLLAAYRTLDAYPEVAQVLHRLKNRGARLAILTNGDPDMIADAVRSAKLEGVFDHLVTVHEAGVFKPHRPVYDLLAKHFAIPLPEISFQSSNRWDVTAEKLTGMRAVWINRTCAPDEYPETQPDCVHSDLSPIADETC
jgi:2-haloacid dehalogenase